MPSRTWKYLNTLPTDIRRKTTPENIALFDVLMAREKEKNIRRTPDEVKELLHDDGSLYFDIKDGHHYSTLSGVRLVDYIGARYMYRNMLEHGTLEYANMVTTVYLRDAWRMLKDVHEEL